MFYLLNRYYLFMSFICAWPMPQAKKGLQNGPLFREDDSTLPVYLYCRSGGMRTGSPSLWCYHVGRAGGRLGGEGAGWGEAAAPVPPAGEVDGRPGHCQRPPQGGQHLCQVHRESGTATNVIIDIVACNVFRFVKLWRLSLLINVCCAMTLSLMMFVALWRLTLMLFVALWRCRLWCLLHYDVCCLWCLSHYEVCCVWHLWHCDICRIMTFVAYVVCSIMMLPLMMFVALWRLSLMMFVALWGVLVMTFVALWHLLHYDVCR